MARSIFASARFVSTLVVSLLSLTTAGYAAGVAAADPVYATAQASWTDTVSQNWSDGTGSPGAGSVSTGNFTFAYAPYVSLAGSASAEAATGVLKAAASADYCYDFGSNHEMATAWVSAGGEYRQIIQVNNALMSGQPMGLALTFLVTGASSADGVVETHIDYSCTIASGGNFGTSEGGPLMGQTIFYIDQTHYPQDAPVNATHNETVVLNVQDAAVGTPLDVTVSMNVHAGAPGWYNFSWNSMDAAGQGSMDFSHTGELQYVGVVDPDTGDTLAVFNAADGSLVSGDSNFSVTLTPEPATLALLGIGGVMLMRRRRA